MDRSGHRLAAIERRFVGGDATGEPVATRDTPLHSPYDIDAASGVFSQKSWLATAAQWPPYSGNFRPKRSQINIGTGHVRLLKVRDGYDRVAFCSPGSSSAPPINPSAPTARERNHAFCSVATQCLTGNGPGIKAGMDDLMFMEKMNTLWKKPLIKFQGRASLQERGLFA